MAQAKHEILNGQEKRPNESGAATTDICLPLMSCAQQMAATVAANKPTYQTKAGQAAMDEVFSFVTNEIANERGRYGKMVENHGKRGSFCVSFFVNTVFG